MTDSRILFDSSTWLAYFLGEIPAVQELAESTDKTLFTSVLSVYEMWKRLQRLSWTEKEIRKALEHVLMNSQVVQLEFEACVQAAQESIKTDLGAMDALIYASAGRCHAVLVTLDNDFRGQKNVLVLSPKK